MEYRPVAKGGPVAVQRRLEAMSSLHANVLEVFDENGVEIMSPHDSSDPPQPQRVLPVDTWGTSEPLPPLQPGA